MIKLFTVTVLVLPQMSLQINFSIHNEHYTIYSCQCHRVIAYDELNHIIFNFKKRKKLDEVRLAEVYHLWNLKS